MEEHGMICALMFSHSFGRVRRIMMIVGNLVIIIDWP